MYIWKQGSIFLKACLGHCHQPADPVQNIHFDSVGSATIKWLPFGAHMYSNSMLWNTAGPPSSDDETFGFFTF